MASGYPLSVPDRSIGAVKVVDVFPKHREEAVNRLPAIIEFIGRKYPPSSIWVEGRYFYDFKCDTEGIILYAYSPYLDIGIRYDIDISRIYFDPKLSEIRVKGKKEPIEDLIRNFISGCDKAISTPYDDLPILLGSDNKHIVEVAKRRLNEGN
jgi:hypothetical protein